MKKENKTHKMFGAFSPRKAGRCHLEWAASLQEIIGRHSSFLS